MENPAIHPMASDHLPPFIGTADGGDFLFSVMVMFTIGLILAIGVLYLRLHALPEQLAHGRNHSQKQVIGILALLALFTHNHLFWVLALLVAAFRMPDFLTPLSSIAKSLAVMSGRNPTADDPDPASRPAGSAPQSGGH